MKATALILVALALAMLPLTAFASVRGSADRVIVYIMPAASFTPAACFTSQWDT
jgi:hypothetical protein